VWNVSFLQKNNTITNTTLKYRAYYVIATSSSNSKTLIVLNCIVLTTSAIRLRLIELRFIIQGEGKIVNVHGSREVVGCFLCCRWNLILPTACNRGRTTTGVFIFQSTAIESTSFKMLLVIQVIRLHNYNVTIITY